MHRLRRPTALIVNLLFVQLLLVGTGTWCAPHGSAAVGPSGVMSSERMAAGHTSGEHGQQPSDCATVGDRAPCGMPALPGGGGCPQASACTAPMVVEPPTALVAAPGTTRVAVARAPAPFSVTSAPDVPPPRA